MPQQFYLESGVKNLHVIDNGQTLNNPLLLIIHDYFNSIYVRYIYTHTHINTYMYVIKVMHNAYARIKHLQEELYMVVYYTYVRKYRFVSNLSLYSKYYKDHYI